MFTEVPVLSMFLIKNKWQSAVVTPAYKKLILFSVQESLVSVCTCHNKVCPCLTYFIANQRAVFFLILEVYFMKTANIPAFGHIYIGKKLTHLLRLLRIVFKILSVRNMLIFLYITEKINDLRGNVTLGK